MSEIVIRKAKKDYVCKKCGHVIKKDSEYLDRCIFTGNFVGHERYHDVCPKANPLIKLFKELLVTEGMACCTRSGVKYYISGIDWVDNEPQIKLLEWVTQEFLEWIPYSEFQRDFKLYETADSMSMKW